MMRRPSEQLVVADGILLRRGSFRLQIPSLEIGAGKCIGLIGPNGAGKTTLLHVLAGRLRPERGAVQVAGVPIEAWGYARGTAVGLVADTLEGFGWMSVTEHLGLRRRFFSTWDPAYESLLLRQLDIPGDMRLNALSKGTRAKVAFVSVEAYRPPILILDEPTAGLDPVVRRDFHAFVLQAVRSGSDRSIIFSTHLVEDIELLADRVLVMRDGRLVADGLIPCAAGPDEKRAIVEKHVEFLRRTGTAA